MSQEVLGGQGRAQSSRTVAGELWFLSKARRAANLSCGPGVCWLVCASMALPQHMAHPQQLAEGDFRQAEKQTGIPQKGRAMGKEEPGKRGGAGRAHGSLREARAQSRAREKGREEPGIR